ncbi:MULTISPECIES: NADPH-dependent FMN reductase [unclassified Mesorhizobium]|uniref:NADPH-dependent FMN reductase n=1 Tax=unclassified Mesorhizobium TaxID=325217 RepID=UPI0003CF942A|nr:MULTISPECIES: NADPH-dependent FMN reductase [unclassified Mesorhizobium]ESX21857.1 NADPH-dependent FMN reductase [Mesorhizobium sp. LSJC255A00]ESX30483.1 NADPH-dependent FMN reductase [Mesorhizobium sp. LSHC440B00]ESX37116.1 NADPH-dependent FMN reductase [Mesorhizobium sp. LSHC432A00]ESX40732.1 NADPH-dependent FMN reductase [Mesorhizobium sp. LSHC440A00]ESX77307.1 NADPH-dependent FMN reductase [Mesorhizobium sp. LSHC414A00]
MKHQLNIIIGSTRPGRAGPVFAHWLEDFAREHGKFEPVLTDIDTFHLPVLDEPHHPRLGNYQNDHTKAWSKVIDAADAFVFAAPEYNYFVAPAIVNAIDYLAREWKYKPAAIFSYGGVSGGLRAAQALKPLLTAVGVMPISEGVALPMYQKLLESDGSFQASEQVQGGTKTMLDELSRWSEALKPMRAA